MRLTGLLAFAMLVAVAMSSNALAQDDKQIVDPDIVIEVGGLACPFCAYGIEKRLKKIDGVEELSVQLEEGTVQVRLEEGVTVSSKRIEEAVADAGFEAKSIVFMNEEAESLPSDDGQSIK